MSHPNPFPYTVLSHCYPVRHSCHRVPHQAVLPGDGTVAPLCCQAPTVPINIYMYWKGWRRGWVCCAATAQICDSPCSPVCLCPSCFSSFPFNATPVIRDCGCQAYPRGQRTSSCMWACCPSTDPFARARALAPRSHACRSVRWRGSLCAVLY